ncbi:hypothetical protein MKQ70_22825 [Chitinophaga sedimenti]|uniref:hypothetical protein n=1 Tax=Chitinophaga sedimenti TaxID=2033606 RepID=UPI00200488DC|nr:hypothetical protein [Chitinophaga sedimenti]MCK7557685.1 hypothetical protein [Chitinophaga sedimenti]
MERQWVDTWRQDSAANEAVLDGVRKMLAPMPIAAAVDTEASWQRLLHTIQPEAKVLEMPPRKKRTWAWAAAILAVVASGVVCGTW